MGSLTRKVCSFTLTRKALFRDTLKQVSWRLPRSSEKPPSNFYQVCRHVETGLQAFGPLVQARPDSRWWAVADYGTTGIPNLLQSTAVETGEQALEAVLEKLPCDVTHLVTWMRAVAPAGEIALVPREGQVVQAVKVRLQVDRPCFCSK